MACAQRSALLKTTLRGTLVSSESIVDTLMRQPPCAIHRKRDTRAGPRALPAASTLAPEARLRQPVHPGIDGKEAPGLRLRRARLRVESDRGRSDEQDVEAGAAEHRTGRLRNRQHDRPGDATRRIVAHDAPAAPLRDPHEALAVDGGAVGNAVRDGGPDENAAIVDLAGCRVEIPCPNGALPAVGV